ncbi:MAG: hypothetical protein JWP01_123 [Myxococcales bacterium]|nr:hypothetical protein [Myxococcales bacterium]
MNRAVRCVVMVSAFAVVAPTVAAGDDDDAAHPVEPAKHPKEPSLPEPITATEPPALPDELSFNGGFWLNYTYNLFDATDRDKVGDFGPGNSMFRLGFDARKAGVIASFRMRWYSYARVWEYGWVGYRWSGGSQLEVGMTKVPFGVLPYAAYDYWFNIPYYVGLNNQYDVGVKWTSELVANRLQLQTGFFKSSDIAAADDLNRFSYDVVTATGNPLARNEETNQVNARLAITHAGVEAGVSGQYGGLYNHDTRDTGRQWAAAVHINATHGNWSAQLQAMQYGFSPKNAPGEDRNVVVIGAFADAYPIAARARIVEANIGYEIHFSKGIDTLRLYNNYSMLLKDEPSFQDSAMNVVGFSVLAGPIFGFVDLISAKNAPYIGAPTGVAFTTGAPDGRWHSMFNVNLGFYFKTSPLAWAR